jgi:hypothetical protein
MTGFEQIGRWLFIVLAIVMGMLVGQFWISQLKKGVSLGPKLFGAIGAAVYFVAAFGVFRWQAWSYPLGLFVILLTLVVSPKAVFKAAHIGAAIFYTGLWLTCLVWFLLPGVRHKFGP